VDGDPLLDVRRRRHSGRYPDRHCAIDDAGEICSGAETASAN